MHLKCKSIFQVYFVFCDLKAVITCKHFENIGVQLDLIKLYSNIFKFDIISKRRSIWKQLALV